MSIEQVEIAKIRRDIVVALIHTASVAELKGVASIATRAKELESHVLRDLTVKRAPGRPRKSDG